MHAITTTLPGVIIFEPSVFRDERGVFFESYREDILQAKGINTDFVQENLSVSKRFVLRGLHYQLKFPQAKLCRVVAGAVLDIAVDIRNGSPTFGQHVAVHLSSDNFLMLYVPRGFAHGMLALTDNTIFQYRCDEYFAPQDSKGVAWNDPDLGIEWGVERPVLTESDQNLFNLKNISKNDLPTFDP